MILSLTACGADTIVGAKLSFSAKGYGSKKLKITVTDKFEEAYTLEYILCEEDAQYFEVSCVKEEEHTHVYEIKPISQGNHTFAVKFMSGEELLGIASLNVIVNEKGKLNYSDFALSDNSDEYSDLNENAKLSNSDGPTKTIQLSDPNRNWQVGQFNEAMIDVDGPTRKADGITSFTFTALAEGDTVVYLDNTSEGLQMALNFTSVKTSTDPAPAEYNLKFVDFLTTALENGRQDESVYDSYKKAMDKTKNAATGTYDAIIIPDDAVVYEAFYYDDEETGSQTGEGGQTEGGKTDGGKITEEDNTDSSKPAILSDITFSYKGIQMDYQTSAIFTKESYMGDIAGDNSNTEAPAIKETKDLKIGKHDVKYYYLEAGCAVAVWEQSGVASRLTFVDGNHTSAEYQETLNMLLSADAI